MSRSRRALRRVAVALLGAAAAAAAASAAAGSQAGSEHAALTDLTRLRDTFMRRIDEEGYKLCPAPAIELGDPPAIARYESERNTVIIATWERLSSAQKQHYQEQAQRIGGTAGAREMFEDGARYVFTHELGHWWQSCRNTSRPYSWGAENGANRIALAFWRERDWGFMQRIVAGFQALARTLPSPVPAGASEEEYFDANFARLAHGEGYVWYQAEMLVTLAAESPPPSFHRALSQPLYPW